MMSLAVALGKLIDPIGADPLMPGEPDVGTFGPIEMAGGVLRSRGDARSLQRGGLPMPRSRAWAPVVNLFQIWEWTFFLASLGPATGANRAESVGNLFRRETVMRTRATLSLHAHPVEPWKRHA